MHINDISPNLRTLNKIIRPGGWQKAKAKYEYEASGKSKSKSSSGKAVVPVCLPLCCALPCVIM
ncbi:hypothetical protein E2986_08501 [Frieseomelitta varia]|uniref:Uncharacterized protein n=1 Tax=Frieseomelitta varia TaxID=561572 RepID=A0A833S2P6_9HYME|nr:hypothetical protein E2986_08501 [Frieseomelitta varia]